jgi:hypothetical protein
VTINTNPLSYNQYIQQLGVMVPVTTVASGGVYAFTDTNLATITPQILNYAELRIQRDLDMLPAQTSNTYTLTAGNYIFPIPIDDFLVVQRVTIQQAINSQVISVNPLLQTSQEFIHNVYGGLANSGQPQYYAMVGDSWGNGGDVNNNIAFGPTPNYPYTIRVHGLIRTPSLYKSASNGSADTQYTYISSYYPDLLLIASMIYVSAYQRNWSATADDTPASQSYEKQYQALRLGAKAEEDRKKSQGSGWSSYSTPTSATPTR